LAAPGRVVIGRAGKAQTTAIAGGMARIRSVAPAPEGGSNGCAALTQAVNGFCTKNGSNINTLHSAQRGQLPDLG
jgi:hypothetical protein